MAAPVMAAISIRPHVPARRNNALLARGKIVYSAKSVSSTSGAHPAMPTRAAQGPGPALMPRPGAFLLPSRQSRPRRVRSVFGCPGAVTHEAAGRSRRCAPATGAACTAARLRRGAAAKTPLAAGAATDNRRAAWCGNTGRPRSSTDWGTSNDRFQRYPDRPADAGRRARLAQRIRGSRNCGADTIRIPSGFGTGACPRGALGRRPEAGCPRWSLRACR